MESFEDRECKLSLVYEQAKMRTEVRRRFNSNFEVRRQNIRRRGAYDTTVGRKLRENTDSDSDVRTAHNTEGQRRWQIKS